MKVDPLMNKPVSSLMYERHGDKVNSTFFEENLIRLLEERDAL